jgi:3-phenylpropionate/trans-cinnamate dioxygenase ferredoxin reductase subunit
VEIDPVARRVWDDHGAIWEYRDLLFATGGWPRRLNVPGAEHEDVHYFRSLEDFLLLENRLARFRHALVVGGGFIGVELSCALTHAGKGITLIYQEDHPLRRILPRDLGRALADFLREKGIEAVSGETIVGFDAIDGEVRAHTQNGNHVTTEQVVVGIGIDPASDLADAVGIAAGDGIEVDEEGRTSAAHVWAAGDVAEFPCLVLDQRMRIEHWDHALHHGRAVGANMAGASRPYTHLPMFWSDLFELHFEAVGEVDSSLDTHAVWKQELSEGVVFYLRDDVIRGVLLWNVRDRLEWARGLIRERKQVADAEREALVKAE